MACCASAVRGGGGARLHEDDEEGTTAVMVVVVVAVDVVAGIHGAAQHGGSPAAVRRVRVGGGHALTRSWLPWTGSQTMNASDS